MSQSKDPGRRGRSRSSGRGGPRQEDGRSQGGRSQGGRSQGGRSQGGRSQGGGSRGGGWNRDGDQRRESRTPQSDRDRSSGSAARRDLKGAAVHLPRWVVDDLARVTPDRRVADALEALGEAFEAFADGRYAKALRFAEKAKDLAPRDVTVREILGLSAYRNGHWKDALRELRTFRRLSGTMTHLPVEMDSLRALGRDDDVETAWGTLTSTGVPPAVYKEGQVVYASHLLDQGRIAEARQTVSVRRLKPNPFEEDLRVWYVAARAAALDNDADEAARLRNAILSHDPGFPGIDELEALIAKAT